MSGWAIGGNFIGGKAMFIGGGLAGGRTMWMGGRLLGEVAGVVGSI